MAGTAKTTDDGAGSARKIRSLRWWIAGAVLVAVLPTIIAVGAAVWNAGRAYQQESLSNLRQTALAIAQSVASELAARADMLQRLAVSSPGGSGSAGNAGFYAEFNTQIIYEPPLADPSPGPVTSHGVPVSNIKRAVETGRPVISNLLGDAATPGGPLIAITVPVPATPGATLTLLAAPQEVVQALANTPSMPGGMLFAITDGSGRIVARSRDAGAFIGRRVPDWDRVEQAAAAGSVFQATTLEGSQIIFAFKRLPGSPGWVAVVGEGYDSYLARWREPVILMVLVSGATILIALSLAALLAGRILRPIRALAQNSRKVVAEDGGPVDVSLGAGSSIREFETLRVNLGAAAQALYRRAENEHAIAARLAQSERRFRTIAGTGAIAFWRLEPGKGLVDLDGAPFLSGTVGHDFRAWRDVVHPDDRALVDTAVLEALEGRSDKIDIEFRIVGRAGTGWRWVRSRGAPVEVDDAARIEWVGVIEDVDERRRAQAHIVHIAHHDALTGLPNRLMLREQLERAVHAAERGDNAAVLCLDLDRFKEVNDTLGHPVGDRLLCEVTERLVALVRKSDTVARLGGDEFAIVQIGGEQPTAALALAARVVEVVATPYLIDGHSVSVGASVGVDIISGAAQDAGRALKNADIALYRAKEDGRGCYRFFEPEMDARMQERRRLELELRQAFDVGEFELHYLPVMDIETGRPSSLEALLRWNHPERGLLAPGDFLPLAEEIGLLIPLGAWVLHRACADAAGWPGGLSVAVNVSVAELLRPGIVTTVTNALERAGLPARRLLIEIPETALIRDSAETLRVLGALKELGVRIAMDNFGSGYSSLGYLRSFPFDKVKIDATCTQALGRRADGQAVVRAITALCGSLGMITVAEGVETREQLGLLRAEACVEAQGLLFSQPQPNAGLEAVWQLVDRHS